MRAKSSNAVVTLPSLKLAVHVTRGSQSPHTTLEPLRIGHSRTIMLVEDDEDIRLVTAYFLETLDFTVVACANAEAALRAFREVQTIDLLITDLQMPGRSGVELAFDLTAIRPSLPVLIVSASIMQDQTLTAIWQHGWAFLAKPCKFDSLLSIISSLLNPIYPLAA